MEKTTADSETTPKHLRVAIIIIGDEILKGHVQDTNSHFLCRELWELGVTVSKTVVVSDNLDTIATEVKAASPVNDFVLTTGGIGPTHDDVTMEAVGRAFSEELVPHPDVLRVLFPIDPESPAHLNNSWRKMALVPASTKVNLVKTHNMDFPSFMLFKVHNVHCYPGVPSLLKTIFHGSKNLYRLHGTRFYLKEFFFSCGEDVLATPLSDVQNAFPAVQVGSYPSVSSRNSYLVKVMLECRDVSLLVEAYARLALALPHSVMMSCQSNFGEADVSRRVADALSFSPSQASILPDSLCIKILDSLKVLNKGLEEYGLEGMCVCFNGGKDCTIILALLRALLNKKGLDQAKIKVLYVVESRQFAEVENFIQLAVKNFKLEVVTFYGAIKQALTELQSSHPKLKATCMGTRRADPHSSDLEAFSMTEPLWPQYMRINCVLEWTYREVWLFLRICKIPYCKLYDQGYTSLDGVDDTHPNLSLLIPAKGAASSVSLDQKYLPAFMLKDEGLERMGRARAANV